MICASVSGGRTSGRMFRLLLDQGKPFTAMFCNTGKERDETLDFVRDMEQAWGNPIVWLEYTRVPAITVDPMVYPHEKSRATVRLQQQQGLDTHWFKIVDHRTARRRNDPSTPFDELLGWANVLPSVRTRLCSVQMKVRTMMRYLFSIGVYAWTDNIGIRADESHRALDILANCPKYRPAVFPLIEAGITEQDVLKFWRAQEFDLRLDSIEGNCDLCFLKAKHKRIELVKRDPNCIEWWDSWERRFAAKPEITGDGKFFRKGEPYALIRQLAQAPTLFDPEDLDVPCGCGDKGFVFSESTNCEL